MFKKILKHFLLSTLWLSFIIKLFVFDFDTYIVTNWFHISPLLYSYKINIFVFILLIMSLVFNKWKFWTRLLFVAFYPIIVLVWYIPKLLFQGRSYFLLIYFADWVINTIMKLRLKLFLLLVLITGIAFINLSDDTNLIIAGMITLCGFLLYFGIAKIWTVFSPLKLFSVDILKHTSTMVDFSTDSLGIKKQPKSKPVAKGTNPIVNKLLRPDKETSFIFNRTLWFFGHLLEIFEERRLYMFYFMIKISSIFIFATFLIAEVNYGFLRLDPSNFTIQQGYGTVPALVFYTATSLVDKDLSFIQANTEMTNYFRLGCTFYYSVLLLTIAGFYWSTLSKRFVEATKKARVIVDNAYGRNERYIKARFKMSPSELQSQLNSTGSQVIGFVEHYFERKKKKEIPKKKKPLKKTK